MAKKKAVKSAKNPAEAMRPYVKKVLLKAAKNPKKPYLTAFQILDLLPEEIRDDLIKDQGSAGGENAKVQYAASCVIKNAARSVANDIVHLGTHGLEFTVNGKTVEPSDKNQIAAYRLLPIKKKAVKKPKLAANKTGIR
jgi:hypothetical protein